MVSAELLEASAIDAGGAIGVNLVTSFLYMRSSCARLSRPMIEQQASDN